MLTVAVAAAMAVSVIAAGSGTANAASINRPATVSAARPAIAVAGIITAAKTAYDIYKTFLQGGLSVQDATKQIITAINGAKTEIISHIDAVATAQAKACAKEAVIDFPGFDTLSTDNQQLFALDATSCVTLADSLITTVTDKGAVDQLDFALNSVGPIALIVRSRTGLSNEGLTPLLVQDNQTVMTMLEPLCEKVRIPGEATEHLCTSYNGDSDQELTAKLARQVAGQNTSWAVAGAVLPTLTTL
jgi:hypothetical protein